MGGVAALWVAAGAAVAGAGASIMQGQEQKKESRARRAIQARQARREQIANLREQQVAQAQLAAASQSGGTLDSSGYRGTSSSIGSTTASNMSFSNQVQSLQDSIAKSRSRQLNWGMLGQVANTTSQLATGYADWKSQQG